MRRWTGLGHRHLLRQRQRAATGATVDNVITITRWQPGVSRDSVRVASSIAGKLELSFRAGPYSTRADHHDDEVIFG